jgi:putative endonuclease
MSRQYHVEQPEPVEGKYIVYILHCSDGSYYCGSTNNIKRRLNDHSLGIAAVWTKKKLPVKLVYKEVQNNLLDARRREKQIQGWTRIKKEKLIQGIWEKL